MPHGAGDELRDQADRHVPQELRGSRPPARGLELVQRVGEPLAVVLHGEVRARDATAGSGAQADPTSSGTRLHRAPTASSARSICAGGGPVERHVARAPAAVAPSAAGRPTVDARPWSASTATRDCARPAALRRVPARRRDAAARLTVQSVGVPVRPGRAPMASSPPRTAARPPRRPSTAPADATRSAERRAAVRPGPGEEDLPDRGARQRARPQPRVGAVGEDRRRHCGQGVDRRAASGRAD